MTCKVMVLPAIEADCGLAQLGRRSPKVDTLIQSPDALRHQRGGGREAKLGVGVVVGLLLGQSVLGSSNIMTDRCLNGTCVILARTSPQGLMFAMAGLMLVIFHRPRPSTAAPGQTVWLRARVGAFLIDFLAALTIVGPLAALPMLVYAAALSGSFLWSVQSIAPDWWDHLFAVACVLVGFSGLCLWPVSLLMAALRPDREFWWSRVGGVRAVRVAETSAR